MRRRTSLTTGATVAFGSLAGCFGDDGEDAEPTTEPGAEPSAGEVTFSVEHSGTETDWGEADTVTVTTQAGDEFDNSQQVVTRLVYDNHWLTRSKCSVLF